MKIEIFNAPQGEQKKDLRLALKPGITLRGGVDLVAVNEDGETLLSGYLLTITEDGTVVIHSGLDPKLGLKVNGYGRVDVEWH